MYSKILECLILWIKTKMGSKSTNLCHDISSTIKKDTLSFWFKCYIS
uniref:Uncharacterized protein n=1 Tax=Lepeophtheirus salmonis TaxID=72036 RepID=A0A0K2V6T2_LEPSM